MREKKEVIQGVECCLKICAPDCPYMDESMYADECHGHLLADCLAWLQPQPARLLTLEEAQTLTGAGWEEIWFRETDEEQEAKLLFTCVFINGYLRHWDGDSAEIIPAEYNQPYHSRLWMGDIPPTDEQREAEPWQ